MKVGLVFAFILVFSLSAAWAQSPGTEEPALESGPELSAPSPLSDRKAAQASSGPEELSAEPDEEPGEPDSDLAAALSRARQEGEEFEFEGRSFVWQNGAAFEKNPDGSLTSVQAPEKLYDLDREGRKWLSREAGGTVYIYLAPKVWASINFAHNSDQIEESSKPVLDAFGLSLNSPALMNHRLVIGGHTNSLGSPEHNLKLSRRRALSVSRYLADVHHIDPDRLILHGYGDSSPIADNETEEGRELNRRVEFILLEPAEDGTEVEE